MKTMNSNKKKVKGSIFLIDSIGALLSAIFLVVISRMEGYFGMPTKIAIILALIAFCFFIYSLTIHLLKQKVNTYLFIIAIANLLYTVITFVLIIIYKQELKLLGWLYFIGEIMILIFLIQLELSIAMKYQDREKMKK